VNPKDCHPGSGKETYVGGRPVPVQLLQYTIEEVVTGFTMVMVPEIVREVAWILSVSFKLLQPESSRARVLR